MLSAMSPLSGYTNTFQDTSVREVSSLVILSVSVPLDGLSALNQKLNELWQTCFPGTGQCTRIDRARLQGLASSAELYGLQLDQCFLVAEPADKSARDIVSHIYDALGPVAYLSDQSDSWAVLDIHGRLSLPALERICMLDLDSMQSSHVARTTMEHLSVIVEKRDIDHLRLYSPRSSASSFLHAVTTSFQNVEEK